MIRIYQERFMKNGDCLAACLSSILEDQALMVQIPDRNDLPENGWLHVINSHLTDHYATAYPCFVDPEEQKNAFKDTLHIRVGAPVDSASPDSMHACIYKGDELVHDPFYGGKGLVSCTYSILLVDPTAKHIHHKCKEPFNGIKDDND